MSASVRPASARTSWTMCASRARPDRSSSPVGETASTAPTMAALPRKVLSRISKSYHHCAHRRRENILLAVTATVPGGDDGDDGVDHPIRVRLLDAAARVFARQGYEGTKIMDIVRESGLSTGAVYGRFRSKNDL